MIRLPRRPAHAPSDDPVQAVLSLLDGWPAGRGAPRRRRIHAGYVVEMPGHRLRIGHEVHDPAAIRTIGAARRA